VPLKTETVAWSLMEVPTVADAGCWWVVIVRVEMGVT
jgi:hypothetical protein